MKINHKVKKGYLIDTLRWNIYYKRSVNLIFRNIVNSKRIDLIEIFIQEVEIYNPKLVFYCKKYLKYVKNKKSKKWKN